MWLEELDPELAGEFVKIANGKSFVKKIIMGKTAGIFIWADRHLQLRKDYLMPEIGRNDPCPFCQLEMGQIVKWKKCSVHNKV
jgi:hypothetical protein